MELYQTTKFSHNKGNNQQNEETTYRMEKSLRNTHLRKG
jgi:hypothetical protein